MKKKIIQWFIGFVISLYGLANCVCGFCVGYFFVNMINSTGKESIGCFVAFIIMLLVFLFSPYMFFKVMQDGVQDKFK